MNITQTLFKCICDTENESESNFTSEILKHRDRRLVSRVIKDNYSIITIFDRLQLFHTYNFGL